MDSLFRQKDKVDKPQLGTLRYITCDISWCNFCEFVQLFCLISYLAEIQLDETGVRPLKYLFHVEIPGKLDKNTPLFSIVQSMDKKEYLFSPTLLLSPWLPVDHSGKEVTWHSIASSMTDFMSFFNWSSLSPN